jgi:hypothetical protein
MQPLCQTGEQVEGSDCFRYAFLKETPLGTCLILGVTPAYRFGQLPRAGLDALFFVR